MDKKYYLLLAMFVCVIALFLYSCGNLPSITINGNKLFIEIAYLDDEKMLGLMNRPSLIADHGMLFVYDNEQVMNFWMKNTLIPLSIAYIRENGLVIGIYDMKPQDLTPISSIYPCKYALEVNQGWFGKANLKPGDVVTLPDFNTLLGWHSKQKK